MPFGGAICTEACLCPSVCSAFSPPESGKKGEPPRIELEKPVELCQFYSL
jgi:hypothetical protein